MSDYPMDPYDANRKLCARIDISKASQAGELEIGSPVKILIEGKVKSLRGPEEGLRNDYNSQGKDRKVKYNYPGSIEIELENFAVEGTSEFESAFGSMVDEG